MARNRLFECQFIISVGLLFLSTNNQGIEVLRIIGSFQKSLKSYKASRAYISFSNFQFTAIYLYFPHFWNHLVGCNFALQKRFLVRYI